jgi:FixJ family two-component response regulator
MPSRRILYVGSDHALIERLQGELRDCRIIRSPSAFIARPLIESINYALLLFDEELPDATGLKLAEFVCSLSHRQCTPFIIVKQPSDFELLVRAIMDLLAG